MHFNAKKCFVMRLTHSRNPKICNYKLGQTTLETTSSYPYLGVDITNSLTWNQHINRITASANRSLGFLKRNLYSCNKPIKETAYLSLVRPLLEYSSAVWNPHTQDLITKIENVQRRAARFVVNDYSRTTSVTEILNNLQWTSLKDRRTISRLSILHKARLGLIALPVDDLLQPVRRPSRHSHSNSYQIIRANKDCYKYSFILQTLIDWKQLPYNITTIEDNQKFKEAVTNNIKLIKED